MRSAGMSEAEALRRARVLDRVIDAVADRSIEWQVRRAAEAGLDPVAAARQAVGSMGGLMDGVMWGSGPKGIRVRSLPPGIQFVIPWSDVAASALGGGRSVQLSLF